jgi:hypothetical protein
MSETAAAALSEGAEGAPAPADAKKPGEGEAPAPWYGEDHAEYVAAKGWKAPDDALKSYRNLEGLLGGERLHLPKSPDDKAGWEHVWNRLGRPESPDKYEFEPAVAGALDPDALSGFAKLAHEHGLNTAQAQAAVAFAAEFGGGKAAEMEQRFEQDSIKEMDALRAEQGAAWDQYTATAKRAAREFGLAEQDLSGMERALGTRRMMDLLARAGAPLMEDTSEGGAPVTGVAMTPAQARGEIDQRKSDPEFVKKYLDSRHPEHKKAVLEMERLSKYAAGTAP